MTLKLPSDILQEIADRARRRRKFLRLSQETLALKSGVSFGSLKRFENTGKISLESLLRLALALDTLGDFDSLFAERAGEGMSLDDIIAGKKTSP